MDNNPILRVAAKILFAPIIVFGLYVQFHGDYGPGGGFQAGVIIAAAFILHALIFGLEAGRRLVPAWANVATDVHRPALIRLVRRPIHPRSKRHSL